MSKDIVKSSAQFVYVNDPNRIIRGQFQIGTPLVGLPQWNPRLEVFVRDENGTAVEELGFDPSHLVSSAALGGGHTDVLLDSFDGLRVTAIQPSEDGRFRITQVDGPQICAVYLGERGNPDDAIPSVYFTEFFNETVYSNADVFVKYSFECDGISKHTHTIWGALRLTPDPITMYQVMWFVNS